MVRGKRTNAVWVAQDILSRRDHSVAEMKTKLARKGFSAEQIQNVVEWLQEKKLLNDTLFAERYVASMVRSKPVGRQWLTHKLKEKGIASDTIAKVISAAFSVEQEQEAAGQAAAAWRRLHPQHAGDTTRLTRHLLSRGFSWDIIQSIKEPADA